MTRIDILKRIIVYTQKHGGDQPARIFLNPETWTVLRRDFDECRLFLDRLGTPLPMFKDPACREDHLLVAGVPVVQNPDVPVGALAWQAKT